MDRSRRGKLIWRWSLVSATAIALFWLVWYLVKGEVPTVSAVKMTGTWTLHLPFAISRWWDILIGPIWSSLIILIVTDITDKDMEVVLVVALFAGLAALGADLGYGPVTGLVAALVVGLGYGLVAALFATLIVGLDTGLAAALVAGPAVALVIGLGYGLVAGLVVAFKYLISGRFWRAVRCWLLAQNSS